MISPQTTRVKPWDNLTQENNLHGCFHPDFNPENINPTTIPGMINPEQIFPGII
jgi:hypothetical protein